MNGDVVLHPNRDRVSSLAFGLIEVLQDAPPEEQVAALASVFLLSSQVLGARPSELLSAAERYVSDPRKDHSRARFQAVKVTLEDTMRKL